MRLITLLICLLLVTTASAVEPKDVVVVANESDPDSMAIAEYYMQQRGIPKENLVTIPTTQQDRVTGEQFIAEIFNPLREQLIEKKWINGILLPGNDPAGRRNAKTIGHRIGYLVLCRIPYQVQSYEKTTVDAIPGGGTGAMGNAQSSVDSELSLLSITGTPLGGPVNNPLFKQKTPNRMQLNSVIKVARLDGPSVEAVKRLVDSAIEGEKQGLKGRAYLDKGGPHQQGEQWLDQTGEIIKALHYPLSIDTEKARFPWDHRMDAPALYFGWWTHVPDGPFEDRNFRFPPGAIAIHISSFSGDALRKPSTRWTGALVERGVAATVGNVYEPYLGLTHQPQLFLEALVNGMSTCEAAYYSQQALSWMTIFVGDPLYQPFAVGMRQQLEELSSDDPLAQYVVLREAQRLAETEGDDAAFDYQRRKFHQAPGLALAYAIAQGWESRNERQKAIAQLAFVAQIGAFAPEDAGLAYQIAELLIQMQEREAGYEIIKVLANQARHKQSKQAFMQAGIPLAKQLGDRDQAQKWELEIQPK